jgi:DNA polymerase
MILTDGQTGRRADGQMEPEPPARAPEQPSAPPPAGPSARLPDYPAGLTIPAPERGLLDAGPSWDRLEDVAAAIAACRECFLCQGRTNTVPGEGNPRAGLMFVGEGPGQTEDETGRPFVGRAGELLTRMIEAIGLRREDVYIANAVKCRPPQNRKPLPDELLACRRYLERQIDLVRPRVLVALGATAAETLLDAKRSLTDLRGRVHSYRGIPLVVTYHPAALLRNPNWKKPAWDDIRIARQLLDG